MLATDEINLIWADNRWITSLMGAQMGRTRREETTTHVAAADAVTKTNNDDDDDDTTNRRSGFDAMGTH